AGPRQRAAAEGREGPEEPYVVGQVSGSFGAAAAPAAPLARLFSSAAPPVLVAVPAVSEPKKRKRAEEGEKVSEDQSLSNIEEPLVKAKKARKKERSEAEKKLSQRENALEQADEEEDQKLFQSKVKQKKKASQAITKSVVNSATGATAKQQKRKWVADKAAERRTVFVGNLPVNCTIQVLTSLFKKYGPIQSIRFRSLHQQDFSSNESFSHSRHKVHPNAKSVNAYVVFKEECDAQEALKENGTEIASGFHIRVDTASKTSSHDRKRSVFLGNLSYDIRDDAVREHFQDCGDVVGVRVVRDRTTGLGKGFGYILFGNTDAVHLALKLNNSVLMGRKIRVQPVTDKKKEQKGPDQSHAPKDRADKKKKKKEKSFSNDSFVGEKANPLKKSTKPKRLKTTPRSKAGKNK
ncbi:RBM34 protein, partial [Pheucticus melanocephalus]|nr:RBM34 protein [Pheucticus melanocephalus]